MNNVCIFMITTEYFREKLKENNLPVTPKEYLIILRDAQCRAYRNLPLSNTDEVVLDLSRKHKKAVSNLIKKVSNN